MHGEEVPIALVLVLGFRPSTSATRSTSVANAFMPSSTRSISRRADRRALEAMVESGQLRPYSLILQS